MASDPESILRGLYNEVINGGNFDVLGDFLAPDYVEHPEEVRGLEAFEKRMRIFRSAFPDLHVSLDEVLVVGDRASTRTTITGTHTGDLMGIPATGRGINVLAIDLVHFQNGKAVERWGGLDMFGMMQQLGVIPQPQGATT